MKARTPSIAEATTASLCLVALGAIALWAKKRHENRTGEDQLRPVQLSQPEISAIGELVRRFAVAAAGSDLVQDPQMQRVALLLEECEHELRALGIEPVSGLLSQRLQATMGGARDLDQEGLDYLEKVLGMLQVKDAERPPATGTPTARRRIRRHRTAP